MRCLLIINLQIPGHFTSERFLCRCAEKPPNAWSGCGSREIGGSYIKIDRKEGLAAKDRLKALPDPGFTK